MKGPTVAMRDLVSTEPGSAMDLLQEGLKQSTVHVNVGQEMIVITEDKMRLSLDALIGKAKSRQSWHAPAGMLLTEVGVLTPATFSRGGWSLGRPVTDTILRTDIPDARVAANFLGERKTGTHSRLVY
jgi:hypothetical protein